MTRNLSIVPASIILAGAVLAVTIYAVRHEKAPVQSQRDLAQMTPVGPQDHLIGDTDPVVTLVTYTDLDCEFCKRFQEVMEQIITEYGDTGNVAWVMRHFPILALHENSSSHAKAAECAGKQGGEKVFWQFISALHAATLPGELFPTSGYGPLAKGLGLSDTALLSCVAGTEFDDRVARDFENGLKIGVESTPFTVILVKGSDPFTVSGFLPYDAMKTIIERALLTAPK